MWLGTSVLAGVRFRYRRSKVYARDAPALGLSGQFLPDLACGSVDHRLSHLATEGALELWHVRHYAVDTGKAGRVRICDGVDAQILGTLILAGPLRHAYEKTLIRGESFNVGQFLSRRLLLPCNVGQQCSAQIGHVFPAR